METTFKKTVQLIKEEGDNLCPIPIDVIPNQMGINLCSVEGISWTKQSDGQLVNLTIHFLPEEKEFVGNPEEIRLKRTT